MRQVQLVVEPDDGTAPTLNAIRHAKKTIDLEAAFVAPGLIDAHVHIESSLCLPAQFAAAVVSIFGIGFWYVSRAPERNRDIIKLGILLKAAYSTVVLGWWFRGQMPMMWVPFAGIDLAFLFACIATLRALPAEGPRAAGHQAA